MLILVIMIVLQVSSIMESIINRNILLTELLFKCNIPFTNEESSSPYRPCPNVAEIYYQKHCVC